MASDNSVTSELRLLLSLIGEAVNIAERYISLPREDKRAVEQPNDPELRTSICTIEAACAQLCSLVARPDDILANKFFAVSHPNARTIPPASLHAFQFYEPACLQVALSNKVPDILQESPSGVSISELGRRTGVDEGKLGRILRLLAAKHVFQEVGPGTFVNNHLSRHLVSDNRLFNLGLGITGECFKAASSLSDTLNDPAMTASTSPLDSAFSKHFDCNSQFFDCYAGSSTEHESRASDFNDGMIAWSSVVEANAVVFDFPWNKLPAGTIVCDVGGGVGDISVQLAKCYPTLHLILYDLPKQVEDAEKRFWPKHCPEAITEHRIEFIPLDFFKECPRKHSDIYFMKNILHDWSDGDCIKILKNVEKAMGPSSRLLVHEIDEFVIRPGYRVLEEEAKIAQAPVPLLSNFGEGRIRQHTMDINMMVIFNSRERTIEDFIYLGKAAGLEFVKLWETGEMGLVEFVQLRQCEGAASS
ncbi:hypothetical protein AGABI1DRAFT_131738 [Agaricus bisporus var. burnettii JB137-S8]|uniref:Uncharacterized protein n=1 Tax=Agaricus bisporus var. burnettii (strain JB137-S8 / ATCC MYA-4627 / FGSC 10392) TaxID=597362 RepID=K5XN17_AGABU|nr:uncharacterized protein AGABI1DRAFT_131738 [Agaricus bisporus var. burnettii JB137-S8]EKM76020.1 hypothetical protein AGABI1DRAFT_131738 [Agaricus bisporus var. burnettii JB137-S8]